MNYETLLMLNVVPMEGLIDMGKDLIDDVGDLVEGAIIVGAVVVVGIVAVISRLSIPRILGVALAAGFLAWLATGGIQDLGGGVGDEFDTREKENASAPIVQTYTPPTQSMVR